MTETDEFATIIPTLGAPDHVRPVPPERIDAYRGRVPDGLLRFWQDVGWCSFLNGYYWLCDPDDFAPVLDKVLDGDPELRATDYAFFLHDGFGGLTGWNPVTKLMAFDVASALPSLSVQGSAGLREIYTYVPAFALGGSGDVDTVRRVQAREHLLFLADIVDVQYDRYIMDIHDPANPYGRMETIRPAGRPRAR